jgi:hypothetical protein
MYYAGSHKLPEVTVEQLNPKMRFLLTPYYEQIVKVMRRVGMARSTVTPVESIMEAIYCPYYEPFVAKMISRHDLEPSYAMIRKGQALIWAANLLHAGSFQKDKTRTRHSQVTHYFFEGCKYHTPLLQRRTAMFKKQIFWRNPEAIS